MKPRWRLRCEMVAQEPRPDEDLIYGEAMPVIIEWHKARDA